MDEQSDIKADSTYDPGRYMRKTVRGSKKAHHIRGEERPPLHAPERLEPPHSEVTMLMQGMATQEQRREEAEFRRSQ